MVDGGEHPERPASQDGAKQGWTHHLGVGRKRGQSGQGSELGAIPKREGQSTPKLESQLRKETLPQTNGAAPQVNGIQPDEVEQADAGAQKQKSTELDKLEEEVKAIELEKASKPQVNGVPKEPTQVETTTPAPKPQSAQAPEVRDVKVDS